MGYTQLFDKGKMKKVVLLGDSHLARLNRFEEGSTAHIFKSEFPDIEIVDLTSVGANVIDGLRTVKDAKFNNFLMVFIMFGTNDAASWKKVLIEEFEENYSEIINILKKNVSKIILITPPPVDSEKQKPPGRSNKTINEYAEVSRKLVEENSIELIDLFREVYRQMTVQDLYLEDGVHLNEKGYKLLIKNMANFLK